jgi:hypothetical protein
MSLCRCDDTAAGGFSNFFNYSGVLTWTPEAQAEAEAEEGQPCKHLDFLAVDHQVSLLGATWDELDSIALKRVGAAGLLLSLACKSATCTLTI